MDGNLIKEEYSSDSFSKDGWGDYDDDLDEEEITNNKINQGIVNQKVDEIEIISPKYKKSYFNTNSYSYNQRKNNEYESTRRVINSNYQELPIYKKQLNNYNTPKDDWAEMLYHPTENKDLSNKIKNSKTFESNIFPIDNAPMDKVRHSKETKYSDRLHKTQITTLPGCIKRGKYDIKDDKYFMNKNNESY